MKPPPNPSLPPSLCPSLSLARSLTPSLCHALSLPLSRYLSIYFPPHTPSPLSSTPSILSHPIPSMLSMQFSQSTHPISSRFICHPPTVHCAVCSCYLFCLPVTCTGGLMYPRPPPFLILLDPSLELTEMSSKAVRGEIISDCSCCCNVLLVMKSLSMPDPTEEVTETKEWESSSSYRPCVK